MMERKKGELKIVLNDLKRRQGKISMPGKMACAGGKTRDRNRD